MGLIISQMRWNATNTHPEEADVWLRERGIDGYGSNFFVESYIG